jgi:RecJ-like exonuclease
MFKCKRYNLETRKMRIPTGAKRKQANIMSSQRVEFVEEKAVEKVKTPVILHIYKECISKVNFVPRRSYDRAEDWMVTCSVCHGTGATGKGDLRKRCPNCDGSGKVRSTSKTRKIIRDST